ncbi:hypothetical protein [Sulfurimonas microaerophilic]|uniref:hypothetical protein n=1 Tax=Sulfurimonas microaerophilic TaxID=3058392 RepID=UPI0027149395|nr:hypothetical protein [Sulfurimonas sp. hsl 1-7]
MKSFLAFFLLVTLSFSAEIEVQDVSKANINSILIFSSQEGLNSGIYHFNKKGISLHTYHLPLKYHFPSNTNWNYFINGDLSFSRAYVSEHTVEPITTEIAKDTSIETYIGGIGGGVRYTYKEGLSSTFGFEVLWSRTGIKIGQIDAEQTVKNLLDNNFNNHITYKFKSTLDYFRIVNDFKIYADLQYRLYETKTDFSFDQLSDFRSESSVISISTGFETPRLVNLGTNYFTLEGRIHEHFLFGTVANTTAVNRYTSMSSALYLYVPEHLKYIERFFIEISSSQSEALEAYNIGIGFSVDF